LIYYRKAEFQPEHPGECHRMRVIRQLATKLPIGHVRINQDVETAAERLGAHKNAELPLSRYFAILPCVACQQTFGKSSSYSRTAFSLLGRESP